MAYWLFKSEPGTWSWEDQVKAGKKGEHWDGVRNYQADNNMKAMRKGDLGFFYHSVNEKRIVGIVKVIREHTLSFTFQRAVHKVLDVFDARDKAQDSSAVVSSPVLLIKKQLYSHPR